MPCACEVHPKCIDSRGNKFRRIRRYKCPSCGERWSTEEFHKIPKPKNQKAPRKKKSSISEFIVNPVVVKQAEIKASDIKITKEDKPAWVKEIIRKIDKE